MKKILLSSLLIVSAISYSQEFDKDYLESLPESIREDVKNQTDLSKEIEKPIYRRASSSIDKPVDNNDTDSIKEDVFGSKFFDTIQSSFMPTNDPNLDSSYILDFGDVLEVQIIGQKNSISDYVIKRDGSINLADIGKMNISGLSLNNASNLIKAKIDNAYIGTQAFITLKNIRDISILIAGNAYNPGIYTLNGNTNILHALSMAGGINEIGSYRNIELKRNNEVIDVLDMYEVFLDGRHNFSNGLRSGDSIVVSPSINIVSIESGVNRRGVYELKNDESVQDLIYYAGGLSKYANVESILLKRLKNGKTSSKYLNYDELKSIKLLDGDSIFIREYVVNTIRVSGAVKNPGIYLVPDGYKLSQVINDAGGYTSSAYPFSGYLENKKALEINSASKQRLYDVFLKSLISNASNASASQDFGFILEQIKNADVTGRVIAEFNLDNLRVNPNLDTILEDEDTITIPNMTQQVYIQGEISNPGAVRYVPGKDLSYYINSSGGSLNNADLDNIFVVHPNGVTENLNTGSRLSFVLPNELEPLIYPGSIIYIPRTTNLVSGVEVASIWAPIISSVALSLTSLSVLNNTN